MNRRRALPAAGFMAAVALVAGACGSTSPASSSSGSSGSGAAASAPGVTATTITFGMSTPLSGNASSLGIDGEKGAQVFIDWLNAHGGTKGHKWVLKVQDDQFTAQGNVAAAQYLIQQQHVFADWGDVGSTALAALPTYNQSHVPYLFPYALAPQMVNPGPWVFSIVPPSNIQEKSLSDWFGAHETGTHRIGILALNSADGQGAASGFKAGAAGKDVVASQFYEATATTWEPQLVALRSANITDLVFHGSDAWMAKVLQELQQLGMSNVHMWGSTGTVTPLVFKLAGNQLADGQNAVSITAPSTASSVPGVKQFLDAFAKYMPGYNPGTFALHSWVGGLIIAHAIDSIKGPITRQSLVNALEHMTNFSTGDITAPLTFSPTKHLGNTSVEVVKAVNGSWNPVSGWLTGTP